MAVVEKELERQMHRVLGMIAEVNTGRTGTTVYRRVKEDHGRGTYVLHRALKKNL